MSPVLTILSINADPPRKATTHTKKNSPKTNRSQLSAYYYSNCKFLESREEVRNFSSCLISLSGAQAWKTGPNLLDRLSQSKYNHLKTGKNGEEIPKMKNDVK